MNKNDLPQWARKYDRKGVTFRKKPDGSFALIEVKSHRVPGKKNPAVSQTYLGTVYSDRGFVPAFREAESSSRLLECGLSHFVLSNFRGDLVRAAFNSGPEEADTKVRAAVLLFLYGRIDDVTLALSAVSLGHEEGIRKVKDGKSVLSLSRAIPKLIGERIRDRDDMEDLLLILRQSMADRRCPEFSGYPEAALRIMERWGSFR